MGRIFDITEQKAMEERLRDAADFLHPIINAVPNPLFVINEDHRFIEANQAFCQSMGKRVDELLGKCDYDVNPKEAADQYRQQNEFVFTSEMPLEYEVTSNDAEGNPRFWLTKKASHRLANGQKVLTAVITDITRPKGEIGVEEDNLVNQRVAGWFVAKRTNQYMCDLAQGL